MCYDVESKTKADLRYAKLRGESEAVIEAIEKKLEKMKGTPYYHVSGFAHPKLLVFTDKDPLEPKEFIWGLIPAWTKDSKSALTFWNNTLNARGETIWEKPSFRSSVKGKRCLICLDAFYEHHHYKGKTYPFRISMKNEEPFFVAGLYDEWVDKETGEVKETVTIVTTEGNPLMTKIHNNPKAEGPRMPVILPRDKQNDWLIPCKNDEDKQKLNDLIKPFDESFMVAYTVHRLKGIESLGNVPDVLKKVTYEEIDLVL